MFYFTVELFIDALILLLHCNTPEIQNIIKDILIIYEKETKNSAYMENEFFDFYIHLINEIMKLNISIQDQTELETFLLKFKSSNIVSKDPELYTTLKNIFTDTTEMSREKFQLLKKKLTNTILWYNNTKYVKKMFGKLSSGSINITPEKQESLLTELSELCSDIIKMNQEAANNNEEHSKNQARLLDFQDKDSIAKSLQVYNKVSVTNKFKTGLQGLNRAFGGGWTLGESIVFNALSFNGKSLSLLNMARWQVTLNKVTEDFKNPTCLFYSLENETPQNLMLLFRAIYINKYKQVPPLDISETEIVNFCFEEFSKYGWKLVIDRRLGAEFGFAELVANFESYVRLGYTPLMCVIDYMNMLKKGHVGEDGGGNHLALREIYTNVCNYLKSKNCSLVTAHQLNRKAAETVRMNPVGAVKKFGIEMLADGMDPQREIDIAIYQHKEFDAVGRAYMTYKLDKHRYDTTTPDKDKYFAYMFNDALGIVDDLYEEDRSTTNIYAVPVENKNEANGSIENTSLNLFGE